LVLRFVVDTSAAIIFKSDNVEISELAFDELSAMNPKEFTISVQSNFFYKLSVKSQNGGFLKHEKYKSSESPILERINYTLTINKTAIPLPAGIYKFPTYQWPSGFGVCTNDYDATLTIGDISSYSVGKYSDILSFSVTAY
jgi:hypothetical protein